MKSNQELLDSLCCPVTRQPLKALEPHQLALINRQVEQKAVSTADGQAIDRPLEAGYITRDGATIYRVEDGVIVMLPAARLPAAQFTALTA